MRIALTGCAGSGRTVLAQRVANAVKLPPLTGLVRTLLTEQNYDYMQGVQVEKFMARPDLQRRLFGLKHDKEHELDSFVTDRAWVDMAAYALVELHDDTGFDLTSFLDDCKDEMNRYDLLVYVPWNSRRPLVPDGVRTLNPWYQLMVDSVIFNLLNRWSARFITVPENTSVKAATEWVAGEVRRHINAR